MVCSAAYIEEGQRRGSQHLKDLFPRLLALIFVCVISTAGVSEKQGINEAGTDKQTTPTRAIPGERERTHNFAQAPTAFQISGEVFLAVRTREVYRAPAPVCGALIAGKTTDFLDRKQHE